MQPWGGRSPQAHPNTMVAAAGASHAVNTSGFYSEDAVCMAAVRQGDVTYENRVDNPASYDWCIVPVSQPPPMAHPVNPALP
jgi:hypothetical protein